MYPEPRYLPAGDQALVVELGDEISPETNRKVRDLTLAIEKSAVAGVFDLVPTYRSVLVYYDPAAVSPSDLRSKIARLYRNLGKQGLESPRVVHIPTLYGGEYGPDFDYVAEHAGMAAEDVIRVHSGTDYLVYMMGFSPGFPYLGGLSEKLQTPRLETPRTEIPAGSVGIAESQTGVYPVASPGGWQLIGRTPLTLFDPNREPPALIGAGDYVRFVPLESEEEFRAVRDRVERGAYETKTESAS